MKFIAGQIRLAATDLSNHLSCRHLTTLDLQVLRGQREAPQWSAPHLAVIRELGKRHEAAYLEHLKTQEKAEVVNLAGIEDEPEVLEETKRLMREGAEVIAQGALSDGNWFGRPDVLRRVAKPAPDWPWSYEVADTKLTSETKAEAILQIALYSELLEKAQGCPPEWMWVIPPGNRFQGERYRVSDYAAYFRHVKKRLEQAVRDGAGAETYPEPVPQCEICRWFRECDAKRRADDHLSLVAGIRKQHRVQLEKWGAGTMARLAALPLPIRQKPEHGSRQAMQRVREQARVQVQGRTEARLVHERLPAVEGMGLARLPEPAPQDLFLDLEGDPFAAETGLQYLFGVTFKGADGESAYQCRWALSREQEKSGFQWLVDKISGLRTANPRMHVYHFGAYEPAALKQLMGRHATREDEVDRFLRAGVFIDLHQVLKQSVRASVERYSLKKIEAFYGFRRAVCLEAAAKAKRYLEHRLELGCEEEIPAPFREQIEAYNRDDCLSAAGLRDWLERERQKLAGGQTEIPRPPEKSGDPGVALQEKLDRAAQLTRRLCQSLPADPRQRTAEQSAQWLLAQLLSWHRREEKRAWQEGYLLAEKSEEELLDEQVAVTKLSFIGRIAEGRAPVDRYRFDPQKTTARAKDHVYFGQVDQEIGTIAAIDLKNGIMDIKKTRTMAAIHPPAVFVWESPAKHRTDKQADSLCRMAEWVATHGIDAPGRYRAGRDLLLRKPPALLNGESLARRAGETPVAAACRIVLALGDSVLAIQGPPGSGKTYTGAHMICALAEAGQKIGVSALSHKVIRKLLEEVVQAAAERGISGVQCLHRETGGEASEGVGVVAEAGQEGNEQALKAIRTGQANVLGGTSWLWAAKEAFEIADVLFIDEAGQMSLADVLAVAQAARKLVLLGDPQQLERPIQGSHPEGAEKSAMEHLLNGERTIPPDLGLLLPDTWRLHPEICRFTSPVFYEGKLRPHANTRSFVLRGHPWMDGAGLWFVPVEHQGNCNSSPEEAAIVGRIVESLLRPEVRWYYGEGRSRALKQEDLLVVAPYNAQVSDLQLRLPGIAVGTVDKFQGQEAPVVIYSLTTSSAEDAPRGMEFLYSLNRFNVATSRAKTAVVVAGNPRLFEPECRTPRQMQLANAFCRFRELARTVSLGAIAGD